MLVDVLTALRRNTTLSNLLQVKGQESFLPFFSL
jgi:hypothetical protein